MPLVKVNLLKGRSAVTEALAVTGRTLIHRLWV